MSYINLIIESDMEVDSLRVEKTLCIKANATLMVNNDLTVMEKIQLETDANLDVGGQLSACSLILTNDSYCDSKSMKVDSISLTNSSMVATNVQTRYLKIVGCDMVEITNKLEAHRLEVKSSVLVINSLVVHRLRLLENTWVTSNGVCEIDSLFMAGGSIETNRLSVLTDMRIRNACITLSSLDIHGSLYVKNVKMQVTNEIFIMNCFTQINSTIRIGSILAREIKLLNEESKLIIKDSLKASIVTIEANSQLYTKNSKIRFLLVKGNKMSCNVLASNNMVVSKELTHSSGHIKAKRLIVHRLKLSGSESEPILHIGSLIVSHLINENGYINATNTVIKHRLTNNKKIHISKEMVLRGVSMNESILLMNSGDIQAHTIDTKGLIKNEGHIMSHDIFCLSIYSSCISHLLVLGNIQTQCITNIHGQSIIKGDLVTNSLVTSNSLILHGSLTSDSIISNINSKMTIKGDVNTNTINTGDNTNIVILGKLIAIDLTMNLRASIITDKGALVKGKVTMSKTSKLYSRNKIEINRESLDDDQVYSSNWA